MLFLADSPGIDQCCLRCCCPFIRKQPVAYHISKSYRGFIFISNPCAACWFCFAIRCCCDSAPCAISFLLTANAIYPSSLSVTHCFGILMNIWVCLFRHGEGGTMPIFCIFFFLETRDWKAGSRCHITLKMFKINAKCPPATPLRKNKSV